ncbi:MAG: hypothetical protein EXR05_09650 [Acetobacteraceae bacterium]|nr:hypothetical protein [Acetobacteraceae bacterium]MSP29081.1 hypothetical protein [Acetobacteraceae bacterium]
MIVALPRGLMLAATLGMALVCVPVAAQPSVQIDTPPTPKRPATTPASRPATPSATSQVPRPTTTQAPRPATPRPLRADQAQASPPRATSPAVVLPRGSGQRAPAAARPPVPVPPPEPTTADVPVEPGKGSVTNLPIPRFAALKTDEVNLRTGPGQRYPVDWVYKRRDLPVQIQREFDVWRLVRDPEGIKGWVHQATLTGRRTFFVLGEERAMRRAASDDAGVVARLKPGVVGQLKRCEVDASWCQVQVGDLKGWLRRAEFWGVVGNEAVN